MASSLKQIGSEDVSQWQELAAALANQVKGTSYTPKQIVTSFPKLLAKNPKLVEQLTDKVLEVMPDIDNPYLIQAILWTLSQKHTSFAINWLSGKSLAQSKADEMGLPNSTEEDKDSESFETIRQILDLISHYRTLVICFDELDNPGCSDDGLTRAQVVAGLGKDLYNSIRRGVILTAMYPEIWTQQIKTLSYADAVVDRIGEKLIELRGLNFDDVNALVSCWLSDFYHERGLEPVSPIYPFNEAQLRELGQERLTVRKVLQWCQKHWDAEPIFPQDPVESAFKKEIENLQDGDYIEDKAKIAKSLLFSFEQLVGSTLAGVKIEKIESPVTPKTKYIDLKIIGEEDGKTVKIGLAIIQDSGGIGLTTGLSHLSDYNKYKMTRGCLIRSKKINSGAKKAQDNLKQLLDKQGGEWVLLKEEEVKPLIAICSVYEAQADYEVTKEQIFDFISEQKLAVNNPLILEILSDPSGQIPEDAVDEDA
ncbi:hypothetical protein [Trichocoleus sp. DQ-A3]|uniref:hypothetical protein n=1 Tax=Trichocoleus sp. DQ-A3 TaxID=2933925 RepID=UPI003299891E